MILLDTSGVLAWIDSSQRQHGDVVAAMASIEPPYLISPFVLAELDYLIGQRLGTSAQVALLAEVEGGAFSLAPFDATDIGRAVRIMEKYADLKIGLADASIVVLSERHRTEAVLTLDRRHFRALRSGRGRPFVLVPAAS